MNALWVVVVVLLVLFLVGALPMWPHSAHWGYIPGGTLGTVLVVVLVLLVLGVDSASVNHTRRTHHDGITSGSSRSNSFLTTL